jgi:glycosyltransferase involved in cell wall biosynthesis
MKSISICLTLKNRAHLLKWALESIKRQDFCKDPKNTIEICLTDGYSTDNLTSLIDQYTEYFDFVYARSDRSKSFNPIKTNCPAADLNVTIRYLPTYDTILKIDPEIVLKDEWLLSEVYDLVEKDPSRTYNARTHFTEGDHWYSTLEDIIHNHEYHYHFAEGGPFSRSKFYFCSGFSRNSFIQMGGIDERFVTGDGFDDTHFREVWKNYHGEYEYEITAQAIHLWHPPASGHSNELYELNRRRYKELKDNPQSNFKDGQLLPWANIEMLSKI